MAPVSLRSRRERCRVAAAAWLAASSLGGAAGPGGEVRTLRGSSGNDTLTAASGPASPTACVALGEGGLVRWEDCEGGLLGGQVTNGRHVPLDGKVTWACPVPGFGVALCDEARSLLRLWRRGSAQLTDVALGPLTAPVGAVHLDGKIYVACFGSWPTPQRDSGLAVVDVATGVLEAHYTYSDDPSSHLHNVYAFDWNGKTEIFVAALGNPWLNPPVSGAGLVRFDLASRAFVAGTTSAPLFARSAVQQSSDIFYVLTQEPPSAPTRLVRLERDGGSLRLAAETLLPERRGGDGGADVFLAAAPDALFCTDRTAGGGRLYYYEYTPPRAADGAGEPGAPGVGGSGSFSRRAAYDTGANPRYATLLPDGDVVVCNQDDASLTVFRGLAGRPVSESPERTTVPTFPVSQVSYFLMGTAIP